MNENTLKRKVIKFIELESICCYSVWSYVLREKRCHWGDKTKVCCANNCYLWKALREI